MKFLRSAVRHLTRAHVRTRMDNYVEPCDYKGYGGQVGTPARMYTLYTYVHVCTPCVHRVYNMGTGAVTSRKWLHCLSKTC